MWEVAGSINSHLSAGLYSISILACKTAVLGWQVKCEMELALKPKAERNAAASATALAEALQRAEQVLNLCTSPNDGGFGGPVDSSASPKEDKIVASLMGLVQAAQGRLAEEAAEQVWALHPLQ